MHALYVLSVFVHILAATIWVGGMLFLVFVVVPLLRRGDRAQAAAFLHAAGVRFRTVGWACFAILLVTGTFQLYARGVGLSTLVEPAFWHSPFGKAVAVKLVLFILILAISALHDFIVGPRATLAVQADPDSPASQALRRQASWLGRLNALLALALVFTGVTLVRGWPW